MATRTKSTHSWPKFRTISLASTRIATLVAATLLRLPAAIADMSDEAYQTAMELAQKKAARNPSLSSQSTNAMSARSQSRKYQVGDSWQVAAWVQSNPMSRMTSDPKRLQAESGRSAVFRYEVIGVSDSGNETSVRITQLESYGQKKADPRVRSLMIRFDANGSQTRKTYEIENRTGQAQLVEVSPEGIHSAITPIELFPLDSPEIASAETAPTEAAPPELPMALRRIGEAAGYRWTSTSSTTFTQDDFFGRGIRLSWQAGRPWPSYLKTPNGVAILLDGGSR